MAEGVLLREGPRIHLVEPGGAVRTWAWAGGPLPPEVARTLSAAGAPVACADPDLAAALGRSGLPSAPPPLAALRRAREALPPPDPVSEREFLLADARASLARALASPVETLIALAREEERVEVAERRESGASEQFLPGSTGPLAEYAREWSGYREAQRRHHEALAARVEREAETVVPNLTRLVGGRVAARLVAAAGSPEALAGMSASRLQLLGARRRPAGRGPRFGLLIRASRMGDVPPERRGRFARSLAALAVIAARADAHTHADLTRLLAARRDRRVERLRREG